MRDEADNRPVVLEPVFGAKQKTIERKFRVHFGYHHGVTPNSELYKVNWKAGPWGDGGETECVIQRAVQARERPAFLRSQL